MAVSFKLDIKLSILVLNIKKKKYKHVLLSAD